MAEYIEREAALEALETATSYTDMGSRLEAIPAADVVPVRHGKWNYEEKELRHNVIACFHTCSFCGYHTNLFVIKTISASPYYYCPNCGAKMEVDE